MMKRIITLLLAVLLTFSLCACGKEQVEDILDIEVDPTVNSNDNRAAFEKGVAYVEKTLDVSKRTPATVDEEDGQVLTELWSFDSEQSPCDLSPYYTLDGQQITPGKTTVKELTDMGFTYQVTDDMKTISPNMTFAFEITKGDKISVVNVENPTDQDIPLEDCIVITADSGPQYGDQAQYRLPFEYMGVKKDASLEEIIKLLGMPNGEVSFFAEYAGNTVELVYYGETLKTTVRCVYDVAADTATFSQMEITCLTER